MLVPENEETGKKMHQLRTRDFSRITTHSRRIRAASADGVSKARGHSDRFSDPFFHPFSPAVVVGWEVVGLLTL